MKKIMSLNVALVLMVFLIMVTSVVLSAFCFLILKELNLFAIFRPSQLVLSIIIPLVSIGIGTLISMGVSVRVLKPLNELITATREIANGNFDVEVQHTNEHNELGELIRSFNHMTRELQSIELFRNDFLNNFSHELKTPIVSIRGFARQLQDDSLPEGQRKEYMQIIVSESERLTNMSSKILLLTKLEHQAIITDKTTFSLDEQLRHCVLLLEKQWVQKELEFQLDLASLSYYGNEEMLYQVWINLLSNAIKFSHHQGVIALQCYDDMGFIKVKLVDHGIGMSDQVRQHMFDKFYQGEHTHAVQGNGLGLSLVKRIVELCGGNISVKSQLGKGTMIVVRLPKETMKS